MWHAAPSVEQKIQSSKSRSHEIFYIYMNSNLTFYSTTYFSFLWPQVKHKKAAKFKYFGFEITFSNAISWMKKVTFIIIFFTKIFTYFCNVLIGLYRIVSFRRWNVSLQCEFETILSQNLTSSKNYEKVLWKWRESPVKNNCFKLFDLFAQHWQLNQL